MRAFDPTDGRESYAPAWPQDYRDRPKQYLADGLNWIRRQIKRRWREVFKLESKATPQAKRRAGKLRRAIKRRQDQIDMLRARLHEPVPRPWRATEGFI